MKIEKCTLPQAASNLTKYINQNYKDWGFVGITDDKLIVYYYDDSFGKLWKGSSIYEGYPVSFVKTGKIKVNA